MEELNSSPNASQNATRNAAAPQPPTLLIFDCDGVLVDSELPVCTAVSEELTRLGYPITPEDVVRRFAGRPEWEMMIEIEREWGHTVPPDYFAAMKQRVDRLFATELEPIEGAREMLSAMQMPRCVASSSAPAKLQQGLQFVGLYDYFAPNIVSARLVARGKPAPDVFVFAAGWMHTPVTECLVLEDRQPRGRAAVAAGMRVWGFTGGSHCAPDHAECLLAAGAERVLSHMRELQEALPAAFVPLASTRRGVLPGWD
jgi:HAD superfamily hydrolase (TIGR01509 family)